MGAGVRGDFGNTKGSKSKYQPNEHGYYGTKGNSSDSSIRHLKGGIEEAKKFFNEMTKGFKSEDRVGKGNWLRRTMPDGGVVTYRPVSSSPDKTPAIDIGKGNFKRQKIHFID